MLSPGPSRTGELVAAFCTLRDVTECIKNQTAALERIEAAREQLMFGFG